MNTVRFRRNALSLAVMVACAGQAHAATYTWLGVDGDFATGSNWQGGTAPTNLTDATLLFNATTDGTGEKTVTNTLTSTPTYNALQFTGGDFTLGGNQIALRPYAVGNAYFTQVLYSNGGNNTISTPLRIDQNISDRIVSEEGLNNAEIRVAGGSLTLSGAVAASDVNLSTNVSAGANLSLKNVSAKSFLAIGGSQDLTGALSSSGAVTISGSDFTVSGTAGSIMAGGGAAVSLSSASSKLTLDNTANASDARLAGNVAMGAGSTLLLKGNATTAVAETAGNLTVNGSSDQLTHVKVEGAGADASLTFSSLSHNSGLLNFASTGVLGSAERIKFTAAPTTVDGLMSRSLVNAQEFATYDTTQGVISATSATTLAGATATDNVFVTATENLAGSATVNSLAVKNVTITSSGTNTLTLASGKLLTTGTTNIAPAISFGSTGGQIINFGNAVLAGGVNGSNGLSVLGSGSLELQSAGNLSGSFSHTGQLILSANDALQGASVTSNYGLNIGSTTQHFESLTGSNLAGNGSIVATGSISLSQTQIDANLQGQTVSIGAGATVGGNIQASQNVSLGEYTTVNGVISGAANVTVFNGATFTQQNTYTGSTTGSLLLSGSGSIAASSAFSSGYQGSSPCWCPTPTMGRWIASATVRT